LPGGGERRRAIRADNEQPSRPFDSPTDRPSPATAPVKAAEMTVDNCTDLAAI
jgi:hypothetical protein